MATPPPVLGTFFRQQFGLDASETQTLWEALSPAMAHKLRHQAAYYLDR
jgi:hypothetical protein